MKLKSYHSLRRAYLGAIDVRDISRVASVETDPYIVHQTRYLLYKSLGNKSPPPPLAWNVEDFTTRFRQASAEQRLEDTVMVFLLHSAMVVKEDIFTRAFTKPGSSEATHVWIMLFKNSFRVLTTLLYKVQWTAENYQNLDLLILELIYQGKGSALRRFMTQDLRIPMTTHGTQAESHFEQLNRLSIRQIGPSFWRLLHWVAEAMDRADRDENAKQAWRSLLTHSLYRFLVCGVCRAHMQTIVAELKDQLNSDAVSYRQLWYNIHNKVTSIVARKDPTVYSTSEFDEDVAFMVQALEAV